MTTMQVAGAVGRPRPQRDDAGAPPEWRYVKFDLTTPLSYWTDGVDIIPADSRSRVERLNTYEDLYHGDFTAWLNLDERLVAKNWFGDISLIYADFMLASPPTWYIGDQELRGSGLLPEASLRAFDAITEQVVRDQVTYGVGLVEVVVPNGDEGQPTMPIPTRVHPKVWFPTGGDEDVTAGPTDGNDKLFVVQQFSPGGMIERRLFEISDNEQISSYRGDDPPVTSQTIGEREAWDVIEELTDGRAVPLVVCPREPDEGGWGWRLYEDLARLIFEYNRRLSLRSASIGRHEDPIMVAVPEQDSAEGPTRPVLDQSPTDRENVRIGELDTNLAAWRRQKVGYLPQGIGSLEYLSFDGGYEASADVLEDLRRDIISTARLPASLLGIDDLKLGSGVALRVSHSQTYLTLQQLQESLVKYLRRVMLIMALAAGANGPVLRAFNDQLRVEWQNPVDYLESGQSMMTTDDGSDEAEDALLEEEGRIETALEELSDMIDLDRGAFQAEVTSAMDRNGVSLRGRTNGRNRALAARAQARQEMRLLRGV